TLLSRSYLDAKNTVIRATVYGEREGFPYPIYEIDSQGRVSKRFRAKIFGNEIGIATYAPDGTTLLGLLRRDKLGNVLWEWDALTHAVEIKHDEPMSMDHQKINQGHRRQVVTRSETRRVHPKDLGIEKSKTLINPYQLPAGDLPVTAQKNAAP